MTESTSGYSQLDPEDSATDWSVRQFQINQTLARVRTMVLVKVVGIAGGAGAVAAPGTVNVQPLVKIVDGNNNTSSHGTIMNIPVFRYGSGNGVVICDPVVNDIGWMAVADRDSSVVVKTQAEAQPGSRRKFDLADGVYMGSLLSGVPEQYITFSSTGIKQADKNGNVFEQKVGGNFFTGPIIGSNLQLSGSIQAVGGGVYAGNIHTSGTITGDTDVVAAGKSGAHHQHNQAGGGTTGPPI